jgi:endogenous inhibitor of DNA gyrase (YacG/DUF329 family)
MIEPQEIRLVITVDCPLCDAPARVVEDDAVLDCPGCGARLALAPDDAPALAAAA